MELRFTSGKWEPIFFVIGQSISRTLRFALAPDFLAEPNCFSPFNLFLSIAGNFLFQLVSFQLVGGSETQPS